MIKLLIASLAGAFLLPIHAHAFNDACIAGFVEDSPAKGTLSILIDGRIESVKDVSIEITETVSQVIDRC